MLRAHERNEARARPEQALVAGFYQLTEESQHRVRALWSQIASGQDVTPGMVRNTDVVVTDVAGFLREFGGGDLRLPSGEAPTTDLAKALVALQARREQARQEAERAAQAKPAESDMQRELREGLPPQDRRFWTLPHA